MTLRLRLLSVAALPFVTFVFAAGQTPASQPASIQAPAAINESFVQNFARDPKQPLDQPYTDAIRKYTTEPRFGSPLVDYLPASKTVPTPAKVLGDVAGAPNMLPYAEDVYRYMRLLEKSTDRVQVTSIGKTEEGREMIAVAVADASLLKARAANDARLARLADPRTLSLDDQRAQPLIDQSFPVYYITGTIHSSTTGVMRTIMCERMNLM